MGTLQELADQVRSTAAQFRDVKAETKKIEQNARVTESLRTAMRGVDLRAGFLKEAVKDGSITRATLPIRDVQAAQRAVDVALTESTEDMISNTASACRQLDELVVALRTSTERAWADVVAGLSLDERRVLVEALKHVPAYAVQVAELSSLLRTLEAQLRHDYLTASDYRLFKETLAEFEEAFARLRLTDSEGVAQFLKRFIAGLATLEDLTPEIHAWIKQQQIEKSFYLRPRRTT